MDLKKEAQRWTRENYGLTLATGSAISFDTAEFVKLMDAWGAHILSRVSPPPAPATWSEEEADRIGRLISADHGYYRDAIGVTNVIHIVRTAFGHAQHLPSSVAPPKGSVSVEDLMEVVAPHIGIGLDNLDTNDALAEIQARFTELLNPTDR